MRIFFRPVITCLLVCTLLTQVFSLQNTVTAQVSPNKQMPTYGQWHSSRFGGGGYIQQVVISPSNPKRTYAYVDVGGVYRSDDGGNSWRMCHGNLPANRSNYSVRGLWVDPVNPDHVVIVTGNRWDGRQGVYLSTDGGNSWKKTFSAWFWGNGYRRAAGNVLVGDPQNANRLYIAAVDDGFAISNDKGKTWQATDQLKSLAPTAIWIDPNHTENIWVACYERKLNFQGKQRHFKSGLYLSQDHGQTFSQVSDDEFSEIVQLPWGEHSLIGIQKSAHIQISSDMGKTWQALETGLPINEKSAKEKSSTSGSAFNALSVGSNFVLLGARNGDIYKLKQSSEKWQHIKPELINEGQWWGRIKPGQWQHHGKAMGSITISPVNPNHWFTTDWYAIYQSKNAGKTWNLSIDGIEVTVIHSITPDPYKPSLIHAGMADNGYIHSDDRGINFKKGGGPSNVKHIVPSYASKGLLFYVGPKGHEWLANQLYISRNHGKKWDRCKMVGLPDMKDRRCNSIALDYENPDRLWVTVSGKIAPNEGGVYRSEDAGETFTWDSQGMAGTSFFDTSIWACGPQLAISENGSMIAISSSSRAIYTRPVGSEIWQKVNIKLSSYGKPSSVAASIQAPGIMVVAVRGMGLYLSADNGKTFDHVWEGDSSYVALDPQLPNRIAVSTNKGIALSIDYGQSFNYLDQSLPDRVTRLPLAFAGNRLVVGTAGSGIFYIDLPKNQQAQVDAPWINQLNQTVKYLKTKQFQVGVLLYGGNLVDLRLTGQPNMMDTYSSTWQTTNPAMPSTSSKDRIEYRGHTTWLSPQNNWWQYQSINPKLNASKSTWPPDPYLTQLAYKVVEHFPNRLVIQSPPSKITGMQFTKIFQIENEQSLKLTTQAKNISDQKMNWGLWSNTRVKASGNAYIPISDQSTYVVEHVNPWKVSDTKYRFEIEKFNGWLSLGNLTSVPYDYKRDTKLRVNPTGRMIIYRLDDQVLVKQTEPIDTNKLPAEHRSVECYRSESQALPTEDLLEIQFLYPLQSIEPGQSIKASENWSLYHVNTFTKSNDLSTWLNQVKNKIGEKL